MEITMEMIAAISGASAIFLSIKNFGLWRALQMEQQASKDVRTLFDQSKEALMRVDENLDLMGKITNSYQELAQEMFRMLDEEQTQILKEKIDSGEIQGFVFSEGSEEETTISERKL